MNSHTSSIRNNNKSRRMTAIVIAVLTMLLLAGCGGTKVYNVDKTIVYGNSMYNVSNVKQITANVSGKLPDGNEINLKDADRRTIDRYLKENGPIYVRMSFDLDDQEMVYRATTIEKSSEFSRMRKDFEGAGKKIASLLAAKKTTQLKLR